MVLAPPPPLHLDALVAADRRATARAPGAVTGRGRAHRASGVGRIGLFSHWAGPAG
jgi:hypothetical protein